MKIFLVQTFSQTNDVSLVFNLDFEVLSIKKCLTKLNVNKNIRYVEFDFEF
jgi:hypothetical protein